MARKQKILLDATFDHFKKWVEALCLPASFCTGLSMFSIMARADGMKRLRTVTVFCQTIWLHEHIWSKIGVFYSGHKHRNIKYIS